jgi:hypothetical protein
MESGMFSTFQLDPARTSARVSRTNLANGIALPLVGGQRVDGTKIAVGAMKRGRQRGPESDPEAPRQASGQRVRRGILWRASIVLPRSIRSPCSPVARVPPPAIGWRTNQRWTTSANAAASQSTMTTRDQMTTERTNRIRVRIHRMSESISGACIDWNSTVLACDSLEMQYDHWETGCPC